ncbi:MAG: phosphoribosyl-ATP diphosphatase [Candidatus Marinamargulisbacteria bacterium]
MDGKLAFLLALEDIIDHRLTSNHESSYVRTLLNSGLDRVLKKVGEEAGEVIIAAKNNDSEELLNESADLLFHLILVLKKQGHSIEDVVDVLVKRHDS